MLKTSSLTSYKELLDHRFEAVLGLTETLHRSQYALLRRDHEELQLLNQQQQTYCGELQFLDVELTSARESIDENSASVANPGGMRYTGEEMAAGEAWLVKSYKIHAALLRRAKRSVNVMINVAESEAKAYRSPLSFESMRAAEE
ncbi:MAG: hypothetical protein JWO13_3735 [Acidobacteriales bacterium]|nr:hypothetical protein [Terriglobales bacterium]